MPRRQDKLPAQRVLIYRLGSLGDTVIALPALRLVAKMFPTAERRLLTNYPVNVKAPPAEAILKNTDLVQGYFSYSVGIRNLRNLFLLWRNLSRWHPDVLVYLGSARGIKAAWRDAIFFRLCGISKSIGIPLTRQMQQNRVEEDGHLENEGSRLARNIAELGDAHLEDPASWSLGVTSEERSRAEYLLKTILPQPLIAVSVGTKVQSKDWGKDNWRELLYQLGKLYPDHGLILNGAPEEREVSEFAAEGWRSTANGNVVNLCGLLAPRESAAAFAKARIFIGHDSGPMHLAAAMQVPCVAVFAARNIPRVWFPYGEQHRIIYHDVSCSGCGLETCILEKKRCITSITVDEVLVQVQSVMNEAKNNFQPKPK